MFHEHVEKKCEVTSANLERSYRRAPRGRQEAKKAMKDPPGICYLCMGGTREGDWEDLMLVIFCAYLFSGFLGGANVLSLHLSLYSIDI